MVPQLQNSRFVLLKLLVLLLDLVYSDTNHVDHVTENGSSHNLDHCHHYDLVGVVGSEVPVAHSHHGRVGPIVGIDVDHIPRRTY